MAAIQLEKQNGIAMEEMWAHTFRDTMAASQLEVPNGINVTVKGVRTARALHVLSCL